MFETNLFGAAAVAAGRRSRPCARPARGVGGVRLVDRRPASPTRCSACTTPPSTALSAHGRGAGGGGPPVRHPGGRRSSRAWWTPTSRRPRAPPARSAAGEGPYAPLLAELRAGFGALARALPDHRPRTWPRRVVAAGARPGRPLPGAGRRRRALPDRALRETTTDDAAWQDELLRLPRDRLAAAAAHRVIAVVVAPAPFKGALPAAAAAARASAPGVRLARPASRPGCPGRRRRRGHARRPGRGGAAGAAAAWSCPTPWAGRSRRPSASCPGGVGGRGAGPGLRLRAAAARRARPRGHDAPPARASSSAPPSTSGARRVIVGLGRQRHHRRRPRPRPGARRARRSTPRARELEGRGADLARVAAHRPLGPRPAAGGHGHPGRLRRATTPSTGPSGAARVFGPAEGRRPRRPSSASTPGWPTWPGVVRAATGVDLQALPGAGRRGRRRRAAWPPCWARSSPRARRWCSTPSASPSGSRARTCASPARAASTRPAAPGKAPAAVAAACARGRGARAWPCAARWRSARALVRRMGFAAAFADRPRGARRWTTPWRPPRPTWPRPPRRRRRLGRAPPAGGPTPGGAT